MIFKSYRVQLVQTQIENNTNFARVVLNSSLETIRVMYYYLIELS